MANITSADRLLAAREEVIARLLKSAEMHDLDDAQMVAVSIHAAAAALIEKTGVSRTQAGEALQDVSVRDSTSLL